MRRIGIYLLGGILYGVGITVFINPHRVLLGGATGLATIGNYLWDLPMGLSMVLVNLPVLTLSFLFLGRRFSLLALLGTLLLSVSLEVCSFLPAFEGDRLLSTLCGGALSGAGVGLLVGQGMVTGGSDLLAVLLQKRWPGISFGNLVLVIDGAIVLLGGLIYREGEAVLYSLLLAVIFTVVLNTYLKGRTQGRIAIIISAKEIEKAILSELERGVTTLFGEGAYTGEQRRVLLCALRPGEERALRRIVYRSDPAAFMMVGEATEILGFGFQDPEKEEIQ